MAEVIESEQLDILHVHYAIPHSISAYLAKQMLQTRNITVPIITTLHGTDITLVGSDQSYMPITRFAIEQSDGVTAVSSFLRRIAYENFDIKADIEVIHNFVDCNIYSPQKGDDHDRRRLVYATPREKLLVHLSNFRPVKRVCDVIQVFARVASTIPARLMLIGDGPDLVATEILARELGVFDKIHFLGKRIDVANLVPLADLMILPSETEAFGLAALEAMACGVPAMVTRIGGFPELVMDGKNGLLCDLGDIDGMTRAVIVALSNPEYLSSLSSAARVTALTQFDVSRILDRYESYYERILRSKSHQLISNVGISGGNGAEIWDSNCIEESG
ncbi:hypothetical protein VKT23_017830 [Stygiomarasmius scandens]|uniref:N-acetyl-alpha-D-glucosaminyl L-malate synthase BshA n=1 Tax=Marasmiellus scandens TaxID=2682957 RepID=A0ABR1IV92_9AGAR